jgi:phosphoribosylformimino-5-aminoimidazole carboxamide ribotide isomerase
MIIYPAIDLRKGRCVRLRRGQASAETVFADDPRDAAIRWAADGAQWLHVVNLDGALGESGAQNLAALRRILSSTELPVQFGGGIRSLEDVDRLLSIGVTRIVLGTVAVRDPEMVARALQRFGPTRIAVGIDAREGLVATDGWQITSQTRALDLAHAMREMGVERVVYTDIQRDGMLSGVNVQATADLAQQTGLQVIASGGVASLDDVVELKLHEAAGVEGVIIGMALYRDALSLREALVVAGGEASDAG